MRRVHWVPGHPEALTHNSKFLMVRNYFRLKQTKMSDVSLTGMVSSLHTILFVLLSVTITAYASELAPYSQDAYFVTTMMIVLTSSSLKIGDSSLLRLDSV